MLSNKTTMPLIDAAVVRNSFNSLSGFSLLLLVILSHLCGVCSWKLRHEPGRSAEKRVLRHFGAGGETQTPQPGRRRSSLDIVQLETKWQRYWEENGVFKAEEPEDLLCNRGVSTESPKAGEGRRRDSGGVEGKPKFYGLCMIPYPSGEGLHVGHLLGYTILDVICRYKRMRGYRVLCPIGWDSFGLPAERHAEIVKRDVREVTDANIHTFKRQIKRMGFAYDWSRELRTSEPSYYKWTQWMFLQFYKRGIAYRSTQTVNWCPELNTVLANEEVKNGLSARGGFPVYRKQAPQWLLGITKYAKRLVEGLDSLEWPQSIVAAQKKWIGLEHGYKIKFEINGNSPFGNALFGFETDMNRIKCIERLEVTTDMPNLFDFVHPSATEQVKQLVDNAARMSNIERHENKAIVSTGLEVRNPVTGCPIKVYVTNAPLLFTQPINCRIVTRNVDLVEDKSPSSDDTDDYVTETALIGTDGTSAYSAYVEPFVNLKLKDWIFSRQRYWGEPIPLKRCEGEYVPVNENELPVESGTQHYETMPQWAGTSWHYLRFCDPSNADEPYKQSAASYWMPVDLYVGGVEHAVSHLLYARFWNKVLFDMGLSPVEEPFEKILLHGIVRNASFTLDGHPVGEQDVIKHKGVYVLKGDRTKKVDVKLEKMSKSKGNAVSPDPIIDSYGADALRLHLLFLGPVAKDRVWSEKGLLGVSKLLDRIYNFFTKITITEDEQSVDGSLKQLVEKITLDIENYNFNVAVSDFFKFIPDMPKLAKCGELGRNVANIYLKLLAPFAPHVAEELWHLVNTNAAHSISHASWPISTNTSTQ
ncbi:leucyl-tRNA synthetase, putative [Babesia bigemina]|uniref:leucine--tRNA ligase n=1 Tax=Babesia bigemina TaxID=5866 RepID=A0A061DCR5_BABBI|nr:leucyl-tRNA synthetase, putative [Babesia bigemina]CDR97957.1 leucyl-tRNA synthetase, putative [Babesia bigemina]|eukprot:XP_012770143.1 leucyl-tRNA synthetase, putative [Babesia bigemina]